MDFIDSCVKIHQHNRRVYTEPNDRMLIRSPFTSNQRCYSISLCLSRLGSSRSFSSYLSRHYSLSFYRTANPRLDSALILYQNVARACVHSSRYYYYTFCRPIQRLVFLLRLPHTLYTIPCHLLLIYTLH